MGAMMLLAYENGEGWKACVMREEDVFPVKFARFEKPPSQLLYICNVIFIRYIFEFWGFAWPLRAWQSASEKSIFSILHIFQSGAVVQPKCLEILRISAKRISIL